MRMDMNLPKEGTRARAVLKAISWRIIASMTTMAIVYTFTGHLLLSAGIGVVEVITKMFFYYFHERAWNRI